MNKERQERIKFYNSTAWKRLKKRKLKDNPLCEVCQRAGRITAAQAVDHIIPRVDDPRKELEYSNLQSICVPCHSSKTAKEIYERNNPREKDMLADKLKHLLL